MRDGQRRKFRVFGIELLVVCEQGRWVPYYPGADGKRRPARDIVIPPGITEAQLPEYLGDLMHEHANPRFPDVEVID